MVNLVTTAERKRVKIHLNRALNDVTGGHRPPQQQDFEKVAELLQVDIKDVLDLYPIMSQGDMSLDAPMITSGGEEGSERIDFLADTSPTPEDIVMQITEVDNARERLADAMKVLQGRERDIFTARHLEDPPKTLDDLAVVFNISRERIRQIDEKAFQRVYDAAHGIEPKSGNHRRGPRTSKNVPETLDI
jgi:RNA polymerase sigma-32 factor